MILDLEDAIASAEKRATRDSVLTALTRPRRALLYVRVNAVDTEFCYGDLAAIVRPGLDGITLPKVESAAGLATADWLLAQALSRKADLVAERGSVLIGGIRIPAAPVHERALCRRRAPEVRPL
jgi:citrate lyase subunit beta / citryl-CoA lyase